MKQIGIVSVQTAQEVVEEKIAENEQAVLESQEVPVISALAARVTSVWDSNKKYREEIGIDQEILRCTRQYYGVYEPDLADAINKQKQTTAMLNLSDVKSNALRAWVLEVLMSPIEKPWTLDPSPIADIPPEFAEAIVQNTMDSFEKRLAEKQEIMTPDQAFEAASELRDQILANIQQEAKLRADRMERKIQDQLSDARWEDIFNEFVSDYSVYPVAVLKGPLHQKKKLKKYKNSSGKISISTSQKPVVSFNRVHPIDVFPSRGSLSPQDGDFIERVHYTPHSLYQIRGTKDYDKDAIDMILSKYSESGWRYPIAVDNEFMDLQKTTDAQEYNTGGIDGLEYHGYMTGTTLLAEGFVTDPDDKPIKPFEMYHVNAIMCADLIIYKKILSENEDRPYVHDSYKTLPGSFWGRGVMAVIRHPQNIINGAVRALCKNMSICSGPQVVINDINRLPAGESVGEMFPWKTWQFENTNQSTSKPLDFFQPDSRAEELIGIMNHFIQLADVVTGIPAYSYGSDVAAGAGRTARGLAMLMGSAARGVKDAIIRLHKNVISPIVTMLNDYNINYDKDDSIKGDFMVKPIGAVSMLIKDELQTRRMEFLNQTGNPIDLKVVGLEGRANIIKEIAREDLGMPIDKVIRSSEDIKFLQEVTDKMERAQAQAAIQAQASEQAQAGAGQAVEQSIPRSGGQPFAESPGGQGMSETGLPPMPEV